MDFSLHFRRHTCRILKWSSAKAFDALNFFIRKPKSFRIFVAQDNSTKTLSALPASQSEISFANMKSPVARKIITQNRFANQDQSRKRYLPKNKYSTRVRLVYHGSQDDSTNLSVNKERSYNFAFVSNIYFESLPTILLNISGLQMAEKFLFIRLSWK